MTKSQVFKYHLKATNKEKKKKHERIRRNVDSTL